MIVNVMLSMVNVKVTANKNHQTTTRYSYLIQLETPLEFPYPRKSQTIKGRNGRWRVNVNAKSLSHGLQMLGWIGMKELLCPISEEFLYVNPVDQRG